MLRVYTFVRVIVSLPALTAGLRASSDEAALSCLYSAVLGFAHQERQADNIAWIAAQSSAVALLRELKAKLLLYMHVARVAGCLNDVCNDHVGGNFDNFQVSRIARFAVRVILTARTCNDFYCESILYLFESTLARL